MKILTNKMAAKGAVVAKAIKERLKKSKEDGEQEVDLMAIADKVAKRKSGNAEE